MRAFILPAFFLCITLGTPEAAAQRYGLTRSGILVPLPERQRENDCLCYLNFFKEKMPETALTTNMLYDAALIPNIGLKIHIKGNWNAEAAWMFARWSKAASHRYWRFNGGDIAVKYRFAGARERNSFAGHHVGLYASILSYDIQLGRNSKGILSSPYAYAAGVSYTYSMPVARRLNIDFSLGVGYAWGRYKRHTPIDDHDVWVETRRMNWFGPTQAGVSLVWLLGSKNGNFKEGGER